MNDIDARKGRRGIERIVHALHHSAHGLKAAFVGESAFRQEVLLAFVLIPLAFFIGADWTETAWLISPIVLVLIVELVNSAIEAAIDRISLEPHDLSRQAKDMGSAAVLLALLLCALIWGSTLWAR